MAIDALYRDYFQKSKVLLYPLLEIKRGSVAVPKQTYVSWEGYLKPEDMKLITVYPVRKDEEYINFEKNVLLKHKRICDYIKLSDEEILLSFDFSDLKNDWDKFLNGKYSQMQSQLKHKIRNHFDKNSSVYVYIDSFMFPDKYFSLYADLLNVNIELLKEVGELCTPPDLEKENLVAQVLDLENKKILG